MKKTLCFILCFCLSAVAGYFIGQAAYRSGPFDDLLEAQGFDKDNPPLVSDADAAAALAEAYYRDNFDPDGEDPRLTDKAHYFPHIDTWIVHLAPEGYVRAAEKSFGTLTGSWNSHTYSVHIRAKDGAILFISFS